MRLTVEEHPQAIKRYGHVSPARPWKALCAERLPEGTRLCSREAAHRGPHVSHGRFRKVVAVWDAQAVAQAPAKAARAGAVRRDRPPRESPIGLPESAPDAPLRWLWKRASSVVGSAEELTFLIFFVAFVGFAIYWFLLLLG